MKVYIQAPFFNEYIIEFPYFSKSMMSAHTQDVFAARYELKTIVSQTDGIEIWLAKDTKTCAEVLLKISIEKNNAVNNAFLLKEFLLLTQIRHRNLLVPLHYDESMGMSYIVYPATESASLKHQILGGSKLNNINAIKLFYQLCEAISTLHQENILHRNIHPGNVFLWHQNFMLGHFIRPSEIEYGKQEQLLPYSAPEIFDQHPNYSEKSDLFAIAATVYFSATAQVPWNGLGGIALNKGADIPNLPHEFHPTLNSILKSCLQPVPHQRPEFKEVIEDLNHLLIEDKAISKKQETPLVIPPKVQTVNEEKKNNAQPAPPTIQKTIPEPKLPIQKQNDAALHKKNEEKIYATVQQDRKKKYLISAALLFFMISITSAAFFLKENIRKSWADATKIEEKPKPILKPEFTISKAALKQKNIADTIPAETTQNNEVEQIVSNEVKKKTLIAFQNETEKWGFKNEKNKVIIPPKFQDVFAFSEGSAAVKSNGYWGYIDETGKWLIAPLFEQANYFQYGKAQVVKDGKSIVINIKGNCIEGCDDPKNTLLGNNN